MPPPEHPLAAILRDAAAGRWPADDGGWSHLPGWYAGVGAIVALTGHAFVCSDRQLDRDRLDALGCNGFGGATLPQVVLAVAGRRGWVDCLDALLVGTGRGREPAPLVPRPDLSAHPRAVNARRSRHATEVLGYADPRRRDVATVARGLAGMTEIGVEAAAPGTGSRLFADVLDSRPVGEVVVAGVAPGNARSLRSALAAGFAIIGSVQIMTEPTAHRGAT
ncbi:MAG TPA: N-acetyltransferase [Tetrasphaera sp.]|nr:N-acetyltransferase [Tetrasphaera sp.]